MNTYFPGTRVLVFDYTKFVNDKDTPLNITMAPAIVCCWYGYRSKIVGYYDGLKPYFREYGNLVDVEFEDPYKYSKGHIADHMNIIETAEQIKEVIDRISKNAKLTPEQKEELLQKVNNKKTFKGIELSYSESF